MGKITIGRNSTLTDRLVCVLVYGYNLLHCLRSCKLITHGVQLSSCGDPKTDFRKVITLASCYELYILFLRRSSHAQQIPWRLIRQAQMTPVTEDRGTIDQVNNLPQKLHDLEWNIAAFAPFSSITLCANTILEVSVLCF